MAETAVEAAGEQLEAPEDPIGPARGIVLGVVVGAVLWLGIFLLIRALL